jgi:hypothetical protein
MIEQMTYEEIRQVLIDEKNRNGSRFVGETCLQKATTLVNLMEIDGLPPCDYCFWKNDGRIVFAWETIGRPTPAVYRVDIQREQISYRMAIGDSIDIPSTNCRNCSVT